MTNIKIFTQISIKLTLFFKNNKYYLDRMTNRMSNEKF